MTGTRKYPDYNTLSARDLEAYIIELRQLLVDALREVRELEEELAKAERYTEGDVSSESKKETSGH